MVIDNISRRWNILSRWRNGEGEVCSQGNKGKHNNKSILIGNKQGLFEDIVGFEDVKILFEMTIKAERYETTIIVD